MGVLFPFVLRCRAVGVVVDFRCVFLPGGSGNPVSRELRPKQKWQKPER